MKNFLKHVYLSILCTALVLGGILPFTASAAPQYTTTHRNNTMTDLVTAIGSTGTMMILTGTVPTNVATADAGTVLVVLPLSATAGTVTNGVLTFNAITTTAATASGTAAHFLICTTSVTANCTAASSTTRVIQGTVGTSGADLNFAAGVAWTTGMNISVSSFTLTANGA